MAKIESSILSEPTTASFSQGMIIRYGLIERELKLTLSE